MPQYTIPLKRKHFTNFKGMPSRCSETRNWASKKPQGLKHCSWAEENTRESPQSRYVFALVILCVDKQQWPPLPIESSLLSALSQ